MPSLETPKGFVFSEERAQLPFATFRVQAESEAVIDDGATTLTAVNAVN
jgi:hypothetical protein